VISSATDPEVEQLKRQMEQMQSQMKDMQKKIDDLVERNRKLEGKVVKEEIPVNEKPVTVSTPPFTGKSFLSKSFQSLNPDISAIGLFSAAYYSKDDPLLLAEADPQHTGVNLQEVELGFQSIVDPYFRFDTFISFSKDSVEMEEAYGTTLISLPLNSQLRVGIMKSKFGRINTMHRHTQNFVTLPVVVTRFLGEDFNPPGIEENFLLPLPWYSEFTMAVNYPDVETPSFAEDQDSNNIARLLYNFHLSNFLELSDSLGVNLGASFATGSNGTGRGNRTNLYGLDLYVKYRPIRTSPYQELMLQSEFMYRNAETPEGALDDYGFYTQLVYRFAKRWKAGLRYGLDDTDDPLSFDTELNNKTSVPLAQYNSPVTTALPDQSSGENAGDVLGLFGMEYRISTMLAFTPTEFSLLRLEYDYLNQDFCGDQHAVFLQFQYAIGAHGAHPF